MHTAIKHDNYAKLFENCFPNVEYYLAGTEKKQFSTLCINESTSLNVVKMIFINKSILF